MTSRRPHCGGSALSAERIRAAKRDSVSFQVSDVQEKRWAALTSLIAAVGLTAFKIIVGLLTGSLGILAEAAHSGLDLVAALMTYCAVRISDRTPDDQPQHRRG